MENQNNNNLSELDQLKVQYETLKERFEQQEIVNDRLMKSSIKHSTDFYKRYRRVQIILYPLLAIIGFLCIKWYQGNDLSLMLFWGSYCAVCFAVELWMTQKLQTKTMENKDLLTLSNQARSYKKLFSLFIVLYTIPVLILVMGVLLSNLGTLTHLPNLGTCLIIFSVVLVATLFLGIVEFHFKTKPCDEIIWQIEAAEPSTNKKTGLDRTQKWFHIAMIVLFVGLDIWAYMIVASHLRLPPVWKNVEYVRGAEDLSTEGKLEIRQVDADTVAISSAMMSGKPLVQRIEMCVPRKAGDKPMPMIVYLTPEASQFWYQFTSKAKDHHAALYLDGVEIQDWLIQCGIENGCFFIVKEWSSKKELEAFCERLIRQ